MMSYSDFIRDVLSDYDDDGAPKKKEREEPSIVQPDGSMRIGAPSIDSSKGVGLRVPSAVGSLFNRGREAASQYGPQVLDAVERMGREMDRRSRDYALMQQRPELGGQQQMRVGAPPLQGNFIGTSTVPSLLSLLRRNIPRGEPAAPTGRTITMGQEPVAFGPEIGVDGLIPSLSTGELTERGMRMFEEAAARRNDAIAKRDAYANRANELARQFQNILRATGRPAPALVQRATEFKNAAAMIDTQVVKKMEARMAALRDQMGITQKHPLVGAAAGLSVPLALTAINPALGAGYIGYESVKGAAEDPRSKQGAVGMAQAAADQLAELSGVAPSWRALESGTRPAELEAAVRATEAPAEQALRFETEATDPLMAALLPGMHLISRMKARRAGARPGPVPTETAEAGPVVMQPEAVKGPSERLRTIADILDKQRKARVEQELPTGPMQTRRDLEEIRPAEAPVRPDRTADYGDTSTFEEPGGYVQEAPAPQAKPTTYRETEADKVARGAFGPEPPVTEKVTTITEKADGSKVTEIRETPIGTFPGETMGAGFRGDRTPVPQPTTGTPDYRFGGKPVESGMPGRKAAPTAPASLLPYFDVRFPYGIKRVFGEQGETHLKMQERTGLNPDEIVKAGHAEPNSLADVELTPEQREARHDELNAKMAATEPPPPPAKQNVLQKIKGKNGSSKIGGVEFSKPATYSGIKKIVAANGEQRLTIRQTKGRSDWNVIYEDILASEEGRGSPISVFQWIAQNKTLKEAKQIAKDRLERGEPYDRNRPLSGSISGKDYFEKDGFAVSSEKMAEDRVEADRLVRDRFNKLSDKSKEDVLRRLEDDTAESLRDENFELDEQQAIETNRVIDEETRTDPNQISFAAAAPVAALGAMGDEDEDWKAKAARMGLGVTAMLALGGRKGGKTLRDILRETRSAREGGASVPKPDPNIKPSEAPSRIPVAPQTPGSVSAHIAKVNRDGPETQIEQALEIYKRTGDLDAFVEAAPASYPGITASELRKELKESGELGAPESIAERKPGAKQYREYFKRKKQGDLTPAQAKALMRQGLYVRKSGEHVTGLEAERLAETKEIKGRGQLTNTEAVLAEMDGGKLDGPIQETVQGPTFAALDAALDWRAKRSRQFEDIMQRNRISNYEQLTSVSDALEKDSFGEGELAPNVVAAARELRPLFDEMLADQNKMRVRMGRKPIPYRKNYVKHAQEFNEMTELLASMSEQELAEMKAKVPADQWYHPDNPYVQHAKARSGGMKNLDRNVASLFQTYIRQASQDIFHTPVMEHNKVVIKYLRDRGLVNTPDFIESLSDEVLGGLAGGLDRTVQRYGGKKVISLASMLKRSLSAAALAFNPGWWLFTQTSSGALIPAKFGTAGVENALKYWTDPVMRKRALESHVMKMKKGAASEDIAQESQLGHLAKMRPGVMSKLARSTDPFFNLASGITSGIESAVTGSSYAAAYEHAIGEGYTPKQAARFAESQAGQISGLFGRETVPGLLRNRTIDATAPYQAYGMGLLTGLREMLGKTGHSEIFNGKNPAAGQALITAGKFLGTLAVLSEVQYQATGTRSFTPLSFVPFAQWVIPTNMRGGALASQWSKDMIEAIGSIPDKGLDKLGNVMLRYHVKGGAGISRLIDLAKGVATGKQVVAGKEVKFDQTADNMFWTSLMGARGSKEGYAAIRKMELNENWIKRALKGTTPRWDDPQQTSTGSRLRGIIKRPKIR